MRRRYKDIKLFILKSSVLIISACYLLGPVRHELSNVLHTIWHTIEMPDQMLTHNFSKEKGLHKSHEHNIVNNDHSHELLSLLKEIINNVKDDPMSNDFPLEKVKNYKHINQRMVDDFRYKNYQKIKNKPRYYSTLQKTKKGYLYTIKEPPQVIS